MDLPRMPSTSSNCQHRSRQRVREYDVEEQDLMYLDLEKTYKNTDILDVKKIFQGVLTGQEAINRVGLTGKQVGLGCNSREIQAVKICHPDHCEQRLARKTTWIKTSDHIYDDKYERRKTYDKEVDCLLKLRQNPHWHIVQILGHYTHPDNEGHIILSPLAECDLATFMESSEPLTAEDRRTMQGWFGCLAAGLKHIHDHQMKHTDIKPRNILVHGSNVVITDFGTSSHFLGRGSSYGHCFGDHVYQAPEAWGADRRGRAQDVWSLVCCYIDMVSVLYGPGKAEFRKLCIPEEWYFNFCVYHAKVVGLLKDLLSKTERKEQQVLLDLILRGFKKEQEERPTATELFNQLQSTPPFIGECCAKTTLSDGLTAVLKSPPPSQQKCPTEISSLLKFIAHFRKNRGDDLRMPSIDKSLDALTAAIQERKIGSLRSAEKNILLYLAPVHCRSAEEYLAFCKAFVTELAKAAKSPAYSNCLYNEKLGERENPYTTAYFTTLVDVLLSRCMTRNWETASDELLEKRSSQDGDLNDDSSGKGKPTKRDPKDEDSKMSGPKESGPNEGGSKGSPKKDYPKESSCKEDPSKKSISKDSARTMMPSRTSPTSEPISPKPVTQVSPTSSRQAQVPMKGGKVVAKHQVPVRGGPSSKK